MATTSAEAVPLMTFVPMKQILGNSTTALGGSPLSAGNFSTGMASPVSAASLTNRSLALNKRTSAGTISPADSRITSPGTKHSMGISSREGPWGRRLDLEVAVHLVRHAFPGIHSEHRGRGADHRPQALGRLARPVLLDKGEQGRQHHHDRDHHRALGLPGQIGNRRQHQQQYGQRSEEQLEQAP